MTPDTAPPPAARPDPVTAFLAADRMRAGVLFLVFALLWAVPAGYCGYKAFKGWGGAAKAPAEKKEGEAAPAEPEPVVPADPNLTNYVVTAALAGVGALIGLAAGLWTLSALPAPTPAAEWTRARTTVLAVGVLAGLLLMLIGLWFFAAEFGALTKWVTSGDAKGAWAVLAALLVFVVGAGLAFAAAQPARAEERNNQTLRQLVYGSNLAITVMLVLMLLVAGNVIAGVKLPNKLDTTEAGFYSLQPTTENFIRRLDQKVTVYVLLPEEGRRPIPDLRRLVQAAQEVNPDKFVVRYMSVATLADIQKLKNKFPQADVEDIGLIVAVGDDESRYTFIRADDTIKREPGGRMGDPGREAFQGEAVLMKELLFLAENRTKPVVYVTQGHGELDLGGGFDTGAAPPRRSMATLKGYLEKNNVDVRPLTFDLKAAKVPDDATVVVVADPQVPLPKEAADAIGTYVTAPRANGKKGKLLALLGPHEGAGSKEVPPTGLETVLGQFNITLRPLFVYSQPSQKFPPDYALVGVPPAAVSARIPAALSLQDTILPVPDCRPVDVPRQGGNPAYQTTPLLATASGVITWLEPTRPADPERTFVDMINSNSEELLRKKQASRASRVVAAAASENGVGRVVVVGSGAFFSDEYARRAGEANPAAQFLATNLDWLRERPEVPDVVNRPFEFYALSPDYDGVRMYILPLLLSVLALGALGAGVWV